jgi:hypothetical protein
MGAITSSDMPGHKGLHERVHTALDLCQESQGVDFKESAPWEALKWKMIKTLMAMGNLRDGGVVIIGASERGERWDLAGISASHLSTYDVDVIIGQVNSYASPDIDIDIVTVRYRMGATFLAIQAKEFRDTPFLCRKRGPDGEGLEPGSIYVRPTGLPRTSLVTSAEQLREVLDLAAEKRARRILETSRQIGMVAGSSAAERFDEEVKGL